MDFKIDLKWVKTTAIAAIGGGIAGAFAAAMDPAKYHFPHDFGSGKLWGYFMEGAALTLVALLLKSPLGQQAMSGFKDSQAQLQQSKTDLAQAKADLKASAKPDKDQDKPKGG